MRLESLHEGAVLALEQLRANKFRSALTILGIVVGVATVMAMSAVIAGVRTSITNELASAGPKNFMVARFDWNSVRINSDGPPWGDNPPISPDEARFIEEMPAVHRALVGVDGSGEFVYGRERIPNAQIWARADDWHLFTSGKIVAGHNYLRADVNGSRPVVVITVPLAEKLFGQLDPIGRTVRIRGQSFQVIGVFDMSGNVFANLVKYGAFVPHTSALKYLDFDDEMLGIFVVTASQATQEEAMNQVMSRLRVLRGLRPSDPNNFVLIRQEEMARTFTRITDIFFLVMLALSSVALMVGGVGVVAIMMIAVTERTREIGVRKALGATRREILWQFLFESATVTFVGGALGMLIGGAIALIVNLATPLPAYVPLGAVLAALGMAVVAGVLFGLWPAWRAARLDPVVALRYE
ncbi:MAG TPA: ABC transporter permease [Longimicrobiales bacterium]|nr:ABC transporter permease [Longimicrobiales bacterium]